MKWAIYISPCGDEFTIERFVWGFENRDDAERFVANLTRAIERSVLPNHRPEVCLMPMANEGGELPS